MPTIGSCCGSKLSAIVCRRCRAPSSRLLAAPKACCALRARIALRRRVTLSRKLLFDPRRLARARAQVVELRATHIAAALDLDRRDQRAVELKRALHAFAAGDLADDEAGIEAAVALG